MEENSLTSVVRFYENLAVDVPLDTLALEGEMSPRLRRYWPFFQMLLFHGKITANNIIPFPKRLAMDITGDEDRKDTYLVDRTIHDLRRTDLKWHVFKELEDGSIDTINVTGNPVTAHISSKRGYSGLKVDRDFIDAIRGANSEQIEMLLAYSFFLAPVPYAIEHSRLINALYQKALEEDSNTREVIAAVPIDSYRKRIGIKGKKYSTIRNLSRDVTKPCIDINNERTALTTNFSWEHRGEKPKGVKRAPSNYIVFTIKPKPEYNILDFYEPQKLERLHGMLEGVIDFEKLNAFPQRRRLKLTENLDLNDHCSDNPELKLICEQIIEVGVAEKEILDALKKWKTKGVIQIWNNFLTRKNNAKLDPIDNEKSYLGTALKSPPRKQSKKKDNTKTISNSSSVENTHVGESFDNANHNVESETEIDYLVSLLLNNLWKGEDTAKLAIKEAEIIAREMGITTREYIESNIRYMKAEEVKGKEITGGYLRDALEKDYASKTRDKELIKEKKKQKREKDFKRDQRLREIEAGLSVIMKRVQEKNIDRVEEYLDNLSAAEAEQKTKEFADSITNPAERKYFSNKAWRSPFLYYRIEGFWKDQYELDLIEPQSVGEELGYDYLTLREEKDSLLVSSG